MEISASEAQKIWDLGEVVVIPVGETAAAADETSKSSVSIFVDFLAL